MEEKRSHSIEVVEKKLRNVDWEKINGRKLTQLAKIRDNISEGTMEEIIKAIPEFANVAKDSLASIRGSYESTLESNKDSSKNIQRLCEAKMNSLEKMLEDDNLTFEEKKYIFEEMSVLIEKLEKVDRQNKRFMLDLFAGTSTALVAVVAILVSVVRDRD